MPYNKVILSYLASAKKSPSTAISDRVYCKTKLHSSHGGRHFGVNEKFTDSLPLKTLQTPTPPLAFIPKRKQSEA